MSVYCNKRYVLLSFGNKEHDYDYDYYYDYYPLESAISRVLIPAITDRQCGQLDRDILAPPVRLGGLGVANIPVMPISIIPHQSK